MKLVIALAVLVLDRLVDRGRPTRHCGQLLGAEVVLVGSVVWKGSLRKYWCIHMEFYKMSLSISLRRVSGRSVSSMEL
jgi:hypothetical protein